MVVNSVAVNVAKVLLLCREPTGSNCLIKIPELKVSKLHAVISYDKHEKSFMVQDLSVNGTFLNKDQRLSEVRDSVFNIVHISVKVKDYYMYDMYFLSVLYMYVYSACIICI